MNLSTLRRFALALALSLAGLLALGGCAESGTAVPMGENVFAITVRGVESGRESPDEQKAKLRELFQARAQKLTDARKYERYELVTFETAYETKGGAAVPVGRGTIRCFK